MPDEIEVGNEIKLDQALLDFMRRFDAGAIEDREVFLSEYPDIADQLRLLLDAADLIESMAGPTLSELRNASPATEPNDRQPERVDVGPQVDPSQTLGATQKTRGPTNDRAVSISPDESTLPPPKGQTDFSLNGLGNTSNTQSILPYRFGDYVLEQVLGRGGMGVVYRAYQVQLERRVAIKMIRSGCLASEDEVNRFHIEAKSAASLTHPNIVTVYQCGECDGHHYFSMDYIPGTDLAKRLASGPMSPKDAVRYVRDVARAIDYAHQQGVVHRDLKPANVLIDESDQVVVTDFGLAKQMGSDKGLTATGATLGTPSYMSPEQAAGKSEEQGASTDVYAIGAILYALLTGKPPFQADSVMQTIMQVINRPAPKVRQSHPNIHSDLETIVTKCLEKISTRRYATAGELADDLDRFYQGIPITAQPPSIFRRCKHWLANVPLVAALTGSRNIEPTKSQRVAQNLLIGTMMAIALVWMTAGQTLEYFRNSNLPRNISIASGAPGGMYFEIAGKLANRLQKSSGREPHVITTNGSLDNLTQLVGNKVQLAVMQESSVQPDQVSVVAPLFFEAVHILVTPESGIKHISEFAGKTVMMGATGSGTYQTSTRLLKHFDITPEKMNLIASDWTHRDQLDQVDVVIAVTKVGHQGISELLKDSRYRLLSIDNAEALALQEPMFRFFEMPHTAYAKAATSPITTLRTTALLVARKDASARLVEETLRAIYSGTPAADELIALELAANWQGLPYHETARKFFAKSIGTP